MPTISAPRMRLRTPTGIRDLGTGRDVVIDDSGSQAAAIATRDVDGAITSWYQANTGHIPTLDYLTLPTGTLTINTAWLNANESERVFLEGGRWQLQRLYIPGMIRWGVDEADMWSCWQYNAPGSPYAVQSREVDGNAADITHTRCTFDGGFTNPNGATTNFPDAQDADQVNFYFCESKGYRAGWYMFRGMTVEDSYAHDLYLSVDGNGEPSHNTGASIRGGNCALRRSLVADGNSAATSFYPELGPYTNIVVNGNIFRLRDSDYGAEVIMASDREFSVREPGEVVELTDNLFYRGGNLGPGPGGSGVGGGIGSYRTGFSLIEGNYDRNGDPVPA